jgi:hypothetical protein
MVDPKDRPTCDEILKCDMVMERIDFFKDREGFVEEENNPSEENKLMKSFRLTKNMRFISEQLPNPNYESPKNSNSNTSNTNNNKNPKLNKNINSNSSLPNINKSHHHHERNATKNDLKIDSPKKSFTKYKLINIINTSKRGFSNDNNSIDKTQKNISMETEQPILSYTKNNYKRLTNIKEIEKTNNYDSINLSRKFLYNAHLKTKSVSKNDNKNSKSKYKKELSLINIYPEYERDNRRNNNNERYNIYLNNNKNNNNYYLPNIYGNKIVNTTRRSKAKNKK